MFSLRSIFWSEFLLISQGICMDLDEKEFGVPRWLVSINNYDADRHLSPADLNMLYLILD